MWCVFAERLATVSRCRGVMPLTTATMAKLCTGNDTGARGRGVEGRGRKKGEANQGGRDE